MDPHMSRTSVLTDFLVQFLVQNRNLQIQKNYSPLQGDFPKSPRQTRFVQGFETLGLLKELQKNPTVFHDMFVCEEKPLTDRDLSSLFTVAYFAQGSNRRALENQLVCFWRDWVIDIEEEDDGPLSRKFWCSHLELLPSLHLAFPASLKFSFCMTPRKFPRSQYLCCCSVFAAALLL
ncbi:hypothetical protein CHARACLAT_030080 [Characodon lateralis]|uniref:Uncharacterized protein n=1 Tax=Characodon lateralis TaxID=208331 RepID=A0ABU7E8Y8_9TELE|nr:hypothetical protein [Characodon lateralis]